jgi:hypothetical protein
MGFEMPPVAGRVFATAIEREQWLQRLGLYPIVTGIAHNNMREFSRGCERLVAAFKFARATGRADAALELVTVWRWRCFAAAAAGFTAAVMLFSWLG